MYRSGDPRVVAPPPPGPKNQVKRILAIVGAFVLVGLLGTVGWIAIRPAGSSANPGAFATSSTGSSPTATATVVPTSEAPSPSPSPTPAATRSTAVVIPAEKPEDPAGEPPATHPHNDGPECAHPGPDAAPNEVRAALTAAGNKQYWVGVVPPPGMTPAQLPVIKVPINLMKAISWAESSWRSTVVACDEGVGLMQIMPGTGPWLNGRFGTNYDPATLSGNVALGATYIEWLIMYFGLYYFGSYDLGASVPRGPGHAMVNLRDIVIASYNAGHGAIMDDQGTEDIKADDILSIPNDPSVPDDVDVLAYVQRVTGYITNCPCDSL